MQEQGPGWAPLARVTALSALLHFMFCFSIMCSNTDTVVSGRAGAGGVFTMFTLRDISRGETEGGTVSGDVSSSTRK